MALHLASCGVRPPLCLTGCHPEGSGVLCSDIHHLFQNLLGAAATPEVSVPKRQRKKGTLLFAF